MPSFVPFDAARSWLLVPGNSPSTFDAAISSAADVVILDIEDAVVDAEKPAARQMVVDYIRGGIRAWVRINDATSPFWEADLQALAGVTSIAGVVLAKTESPEQVLATAERLRPGTPVVALVESARGIQAASAIAEAGPTSRLAFGSGDFRRDTGMSADPAALAFPRSQLVIASRAALLPPPIDGPTLCDDPKVLYQATDLAMTMGMSGKLCMHPAHANAVNEALTPTMRDIDNARIVIDELGVDGARVRNGSDRPRLAEARKTLSRAESFGMIERPAPCL